MSTPAKSIAGAVLAGGAGRRIGGAKALAVLAGRPLIDYPLGAMRGAGLSPLAIVAKRDTELPRLDGVELWLEPDQPQHPLVGIVHAVRSAAGAPVLVCAADMPLLRAETLARIAATDRAGAIAVVATSGARGLQPLLALYTPAAADLLGPAARAGRAPTRAVVAGLEPVLVEVDDDELYNVNSPEELAEAERRLSRT